MLDVTTISRPNVDHIAFKLKYYIYEKFCDPPITTIKTITTTATTILVIMCQYKEYAHIYANEVAEYYFFVY